MRRKRGREREQEQEQGERKRGAEQRAEQRAEGRGSSFGFGAERRLSDETSLTETTVQCKGGCGSASMDSMAYAGP